MFSAAGHVLDEFLSFENWVLKFKGPGLLKKG
jgi:hypothetical protein